MSKPPGRNAVSPYLVVADAKAALAFIAATFGAKPDFIARREDGAIQHAEVRIDDSVVMIGEAAGGPESNVHVYVPDLDAAFARALKAGGVAVQRPEEKGDGDRRGGVRDPCGTIWWLSSFVSADDRRKTNSL